jgi:crotonobetainyl-CoA:carnitine CoA-transferase CaiB-like acyl-CoA transferase
VIKIETPGRGDVSRFMNISEKFRLDIPRSGGDYFLTVNRNKRSVAVNLKSAEGRDIAVRLASGADIVMESFRPGVMAGLGLDYSSLSEVNRKLIYGSLSAYSDRGPLSGQPGMDVAIQAKSGVMALTGEPGSGPLRPGVSLADFSGGVHFAIALLAALIRRGVQGVGERVEVSLMDATMAMLGNYSVATMDGGVEFSPMGSGHPQLVPYQAFETSDGYVVVATGTNKLFRLLCSLLGLDEIATDPRFATNTARVTHRHELVPLIAARMAERPVAEWLEILTSAGIPCAKINSIREAFVDRDVVENELIRHYAHPTYGDIHLVGSPYRFEGSRVPPGIRPPVLGEHTAVVLHEKLGLSREELADLEARGVIAIDGVTETSA